LLADPALKEPPDPPDPPDGVLGAGDTAADVEGDATSTLETGVDDAGTVRDVYTDDAEWEVWDGTRSSGATTLEVDADEEGATAAATGLFPMRAASDEEPALAAVDEVRAGGEEILGRGREEESAASTLASGLDERAAITLDAGAVVTGTARDTAGRLEGPVPVTSARKAVIHPSNASNSCFNWASAATWSMVFAESI